MVYAYNEVKVADVVLWVTVLTLCSHEVAAQWVTSMALKLLPPDACK